MLVLNMIVKDGLVAPSNILRAISSVAPLLRYAVVVDTGSTDDTVFAVKRLLKQLNVPGKIVKSKWRDDFAHARNVALKHSPVGRILWMDADEEFPKNQVKYLSGCLDEHPDRAIVFYTCGPNILRPHPRCRIFPKLRGVQWTSPLHEDVSQSVHEAGVGFVVCGATMIHWGYGGAQKLVESEARNAHITGQEREKRRQAILADASIPSEDKLAAMLAVDTLDLGADGKGGTLAPNLLMPAHVPTPEELAARDALAQTLNDAADSASARDNLARPEHYIIDLDPRRDYTAEDLAPVMARLRELGLDIEPLPPNSIWNMESFALHLEEVLGRNYLPWDVQQNEMPLAGNALADESPSLPMPDLNALLNEMVASDPAVRPDMAALVHSGGKARVPIPAGVLAVAQSQPLELMR